MGSKGDIPVCSNFFEDEIQKAIYRPTNVSYH